MSAAAVVGLHLLTLHLGASDLSPINPGMYFRSEAGFTAGMLRNSYHRLSTYAGWTWQTGDGRFALTVGAITGYPAAVVMPLVSPSIRFGNARLSFIPRPIKGGTSAGLHLSFERSWP